MRVKVNQKSAVEYERSLDRMIAVTLGAVVALSALLFS